METVELAEVAAVLAEPSRAAMCLALLDGRAWTVGELAKAAGVGPSTASEHVTRLREAGFVAGAKQGRHSYVRIADPRVAELIEHLAQHAGHRPARGLKASLRARRLAFARTCYDHLAGTLGVAIRDGMVRTGLVSLDDGLTLTARGRAVLAELSVPVPEGGRRPLLRDCLDWTERREHFGGALPAALLGHAVAAGWLRREPHRAIRLLTPEPFARLGADLARAEVA
ncbi:ArsR/SmtB family transcription factor [Amycolatopsis alkalitolerans]|uniref:Winged helix-turn-helix transcriptional regulator n=1 Tax=Amycolatopsis alkalitolerans TaxID=2547244 RepID=A0A5C4LU16_9PSEU|nr:metalloregulator ArsR/SmtB family transcription factor [Amycolatopsis alkalitolerans]TNC22660.1 winged helix-turn-helix transcriptional regulator [Amycolatopsis alkalitolerans]